MKRSREIPGVRDRRRLITGLSVSALVHLVIAILLLTAEPPADTSTKRETVRLRILDEARSAARVSPKPKAHEPIEGQVVELPKPAVEEIPDSARFLSQWDRKVEKETKAPRMPTGKAGHPGNPQGSRQPPRLPRRGLPTGRSRCHPRRRRLRPRLPAGRPRTIPARGSGAWRAWTRCWSPRWADRGVRCGRRAPCPTASPSGA